MPAPFDHWENKPDQTPAPYEDPNCAGPNRPGSCWLERIHYDQANPRTMTETTWKEFFDQHAPHYDQNSFTKNTKVEVQFLSDVMGLQPGMTLLDMGCGTGRHAVEFARLGLQVTGVDLSPGMLKVAQEKASANDVTIEFIEADASQWARQHAFDAAICICEGGLGLIDAGANAVAHDLSILNNIAASLKSQAPFAMTCLNGYATIRRVTDEMIEQGSFNPATMDMAYVDEMNLPEGTVAKIVRERLFIPPEVASMLHHAGFEVQHIWGGTAGDWGKRPLKMDEIEMMALCKRR